ncbi:MULTISPECIES: ADP-forming succinate--CoA ligase subunit beta [Xanthomonas]|uniref:Succinate--CoA ligase [ADP-forming] subunit beta n=1 Tax=Xanthomonas dyei TaxID=743699 RepID=A0ABZ0D556_9XANT|nr:ADP-forming succinate--CoA ligase subunit beta [Xanthomonas dyei]WOB25423.1 ADP-forming succinate--CoA ligase subunit beta [Xanthomonas dyei]WOB53049.1 ADP-forming succinate--CoA ligase subunit beta [Xanthomonas dyei]
MNFHEYQSKQLLAEYGIPVPAGKVAATPDEAVEVANSLGKGPWMVKAQIHAGGRGKAGGVKFCKTNDDVKAAAAKMLGTKMSTYQTAGVELPINLVLVTTAGEIVKELYLSILVDRGTKTITYIASSEGGVEIEQVAAETPELIHALNVDFVEGVQGYHGRDFGFKLGLNAKQAGQFASIMINLYKLFNEKDLALVEINPLAILDDGNLYALDGKFDSDDNAAFRQKQLIAMRDKTQEDETEVTASELDINYVTMDGNIGCMVNGAGLAMATMDVIKLNGGEPANFLDVGGGANKQRVIEAFKLILSSDKVEGIFVNIFGGIVRCDMIAEGIIAAVKEVGVKVPVVVRLEGTNVEEGKQLLRDSGMAIIPADNINDGAKKVVEAVKNAA